MNRILRKKISKTNILLELFYNNKTFIPTFTSDLLINVCSENIKKQKKILDLGCGISIVSIALNQILKNKKFYGSDLSKDSIEISKLNAKKYNLDIDLKYGDCFDPWEGYKFDCIIDDVSGISSELAIHSNWFKNIPCDAGNDGTKLIEKVLVNSKSYLNKNGNLFFPIISLSNKNKILKIAKENFKNVILLKSKKWFLSHDLEKHIEIMKVLKDKNFIDFKFEFGKIVCYTDIYNAFN